MGPAQAGASNKCPAGFRGLVSEVVSKTDRPLIITEFGQACCPTAGAVGQTGFTQRHNGAHLRACEELAEKHPRRFITRPSSHRDGAGVLLRGRVPPSMLS